MHSLKKRAYHRRPIATIPWKALLTLLIVILGTWSGAALAQDSGSTSHPLSGDVKVAIDTIWLLFSAVLVFFMNAGFAMLETGLCRSKNAVNLLIKNLIVFGVVTLAYWTTGFGLMFGDGNAVLGTQGFWLQGLDNSPLVGEAYQGVFSALKTVGVPLEAKFFFQLVFAGTAATIVSGAVAERIAFFAYFVFCFILAGLIYPIAGHWVWGNGFLNTMGFYDFAGSTVVHSVGGWAALVGAILVGPRLGRYTDNQSIPMPGHNLGIATLGCFILWLGWFGFNTGSLMEAHPTAISHILLTTNMAAAAGAIGAAISSWVVFSRPDLPMIINGILAALVSVTASCAYIETNSAVAIGIVGGMIAVFASYIFDRFQVDDPVGALPVHLVGGIWGTLAVGLFAVGPNVYSWYGAGDGPSLGVLLGGDWNQLRIQVCGVGIVALFTMAASWLGWFIIDYLFGLRVSPAAEDLGLDITQHGMRAYPDFQTSVQQHEVPSSASLAIKRTITQNLGSD